MASRRLACPQFARHCETISVAHLFFSYYLSFQPAAQTSYPERPAQLRSRESRIDASEPTSAIRQSRLLLIGPGVRASPMPAKTRALEEFWLTHACSHNGRSASLFAPVCLRRSVCDRVLCAHFSLQETTDSHFAVALALRPYSGSAL